MNAGMTSLEPYVLVFLSVGCPATVLDSSAAISVLQSPLLFAFILCSEGLRRSLKRVGDSRSRFPNKIALNDQIILA